MHSPIVALREIGASDAAPAARHVLHFDIETRSPALLKNIGAHRYAADLRTEILCAAYAANQEPIKLWLPGDPVPPEFVKVAHDPHWMMCAHNAVFEMAVVQRILEPRHGFPPIPPEKFICTMTAALAL